MCLRKAPGIVAAWHSRAARKHLLQIRAPLKCFTKSALSSPIVPRATQLTGPHLRVGLLAYVQVGGGRESRCNPALYAPRLSRHYFLDG